MRKRLAYMGGLVMLAALMVPSMAFATGSFLGTITAPDVLDQAVALTPYFGPVVLVVVGIGLAIWGVNWIIQKLKAAVGGGGRGRR